MLPLTGVKVVEFANNIAGPYAGYILAMLGADVLKIERPEGGDDARAWGPPFWKDTSATFQCLNVNKKGITLDLKSADDIDWVKDYIESCDVLIHNLRPGVMDGLGLGAAALHRAQPAPRLLLAVGLRPQGSDAEERRLRADGAGLLRAVLRQRLSRPSRRAHRHLGAGSRQRGVGGAGLRHRRAAARAHGQGLRRRRLAVRDGARVADRALRALPGRRPAARAASERQPGGGAVPGHRLLRRAGDRGRRQRPAVGQIHGRDRPPRVGAGPALQDQRRPSRQQGRAGRSRHRDHAARRRGRSGCGACRGPACRARRSTTSRT